MATAALLAAVGDGAAAFEVYSAMPPVVRRRYGDRLFLSGVGDSGGGVRWAPKLTEAALGLKSLSPPFF